MRRRIGTPNNDSNLRRDFAKICKKAKLTTAFPATHGRSYHPEIKIQGPLG